MGSAVTAIKKTNEVITTITDGQTQLVQGLNDFNNCFKNVMDSSKNIKNRFISFKNDFINFISNQKNNPFFYFVVFVIFLFLLVLTFLIWKYILVLLLFLMLVVGLFVIAFLAGQYSVGYIPNQETLNTNNIYIYNEPKWTLKDNKRYYELKTARDLYWFADQVNRGKNTMNAIVMNDLELNTGKMSENSGRACVRVWIPMCSY